MEKIIVLGDVHGRYIWDDIVKKENPDLTIFLGDYVSTHEDIISDVQIYNLCDILNYKEQNPDKVILLRGNHDIQHLGYYWADCSGYDRKVAEWMSQSSVRERFLKNTQWLYFSDELNTIFSHAGVSSVWLESIKTYLKAKQGPQYNNISDIETLNKINDIEPCELFGFTPDNYFDSYGDSKTQPLTWIRPQSLCQYNVKGYDQVVGHTPVQRGILNMKKAVGGNQNIWLCDALGINQYLKIENGEFLPCKFEKDEN